MTLNTGLTQTALDSKGLGELRRSATADKTDQATLKQVAGQFEALFTTMLLKSMRQASLAEGIFDNSQSDMYRDMSDQQLAIDLSSKGGLGLQDAIIRQLGGEPDKNTSNRTTQYSGSIENITRRAALPPRPVVNTDLIKEAVESVPQSELKTATEQPTDFIFDSPKQFVEKLLPLAKKAATLIGVSPKAILAQAALETGWGKHVINKLDGESSFNLFNIKADRRWQGEAAEIGTVEYRDGVAVKEPAKFRSYESYEDSFNDYIDFLQTQPRYQDALKQTGNSEEFIEGLHKAGYATDPSYADKIKRIMNGSTLAQFSQYLDKL